MCTELQGSEAISWAAYHAQSQQEVLPDGNTALSALLPLFHDEAKSVAMIRHAMDVVRSAVEMLNPSQIPIIRFFIIYYLLFIIYYLLNNK